MNQRFELIEKKWKCLGKTGCKILRNTIWMSLNNTNVDDGLHCEVEKVSDQEREIYQNKCDNSEIIKTKYFEKFSSPRLTTYLSMLPAQG